MPNYLNLYEALNLTPPVFATVPHILNETGNKKLGKRDGAKDVLEYLKEGFLPEALVNFIASLGWNDGTEQEVFSLDELIAKFSLDRVGRGGARFDEKRLLWLNGQWIKRLSLEELYSRATIGATLTERATTAPNRSRRGGAFMSAERPFGQVSAQSSENFWGEFGAKADSERQKAVLVVIQERLKTLADLPSLSEYFFMRPEPNWAMIDDNKQLKKLTHAEQIELLKTAHQELAKLETTDWQTETLQSKLNELLEITAQKPPILFGLIRYALTWAPFSPGLPETMQLLGRDETLTRLSTQK
jgi:glutamyl/glutaminyl-tRNA synthetase